MVGEVFHIGGVLVLDAFGQILQLVLNQAAPLASILVDGLGNCSLLLMLLCVWVKCRLLAPVPQGSHHTFLMGPGPVLKGKVKT